MNPITRKEWPKYARHPQFGRARFDGPGDVPTEWVVEGDKKPLHTRRKETPEDVAIASMPDIPLSAEEVELNQLRKQYFDDWGKKAPAQWTAQMIRNRMGQGEEAA